MPGSRGQSFHARGGTGVSGTKWELVLPSPPPYSVFYPSLAQREDPLALSRERIAAYLSNIVDEGSSFFFPHKTPPTGDYPAMPHSSWNTLVFRKVGGGGCSLWKALSLLPASQRNFIFPLFQVATFPVVHDSAVNESFCN